MYIFIKVDVTYSENIPILIAGNIILNTNYLSGKDTKKMLIERPSKLFVKHNRSDKTILDKNNNWGWEIFDPYIDDDGKFIVKYNQAAYTRDELLNVIGEYEYNNNEIPDPIGLLNAIFELINYPNK